MMACEKPLSMRIVEKARKMLIILTSPKADGATNWAMINVQSTCMPIFATRSVILQKVALATMPIPFFRRPHNE